MEKTSKHPPFSEVRAVPEPKRYSCSGCVYHNDNRPAEGCFLPDGPTEDEISCSGTIFVLKKDGHWESAADPVRNTMLKCTVCGSVEPELDWESVWSPKHKGFINTCCSHCRAVGKSQYVLNHPANKPGRFIATWERVKEVLNNEPSYKQTKKGNEDVNERCSHIKEKETTMKEPSVVAHFRSDIGEAPITQHSGNKYVRTIRDCLTGKEIGQVDVYSVLEAFNVACPGRQHAIKKLLCAGLREKGSAVKDLKEAIDALRRALIMAEAKTPKSMEESP